MIRRMMTLVLGLILAIASTGCWDREEVDRLAIVVGLGVDQIPGPKPILLTAQIVNPSSMRKEAGGEQGNPFVVTTAQGKSVFDAVRNFAKNSPRRMFFSHNSIIVIGDSLGRSGIKDILDYFERDPQFRRTTWMLVAPKTAKEILEAKLDLEKLSALGVKEMIREYHQSTAVKVIQRKDFMSSLASKSASAVASRIELIDEEADVERKLAKETGGGESRDKRENGQGKRGKQLRLSGSALFHKDKLEGYLDEVETRGLLWMLGEVREGAVVVPCSDDKKESVVFRIERTKHKLLPVYEGEQLKMRVEIEEESEIAEVNCKNMDISKPETIKKLEVIQAKDIEERIMKTVRKAQKLQSDVLKFGDAFHRKDPKKWKQVEESWGEHFAKVKVTVNVTAKIRRVGMTSKSIEVGE